jgi:hypothetical protein
VDEVLAREFVRAANQMNQSLTIYQVDQRLGNQESRFLLVQCAITGCSLLSNDTYVRALVDDARSVHDLRWHPRRDKRAITGRDHFEHFLGIERRLLEQAGTDPRLTEEIIGRCREARKVTRRGRFGANAFSSALEELRLLACDVLAELRKTTFDQPPPDQLPRRLASVLKGVCGCVIVGLDASESLRLAPNVGLSDAGSAVSIAVGGAIVTQAITDLSGAGCRPRMLRGVSDTNRKAIGQLLRTGCLLGRAVYAYSYL